MEIYLITDMRATGGGSDMRFVLSDVDHALMEYYRYASRILSVRVKFYTSIYYCYAWHEFLVKDSVKYEILILITNERYVCS